MFFVNVQHPFISQAKPVTILRDLITEAMEMKAKRQQEQQRELEEEDDNSVRMIRAQVKTTTRLDFVRELNVGILKSNIPCRPGGGDGGGLPHDGEVRLRGSRDHAGHQHHERWGADHDRTWQHHAGVRPGHHGHQQRR